MNNFWTIRIDDAAPQWHLYALQEKGDCYLSANTKIVGFDKAVQLTSEELAKSFREAVLPTLRRRHGEDVRALICTCQTTSSRVDDPLVKARVAEVMFTPNKRPASLA